MTIKSIAICSATILALLMPEALAQAQEERGILNLGDAVVTGFSGVVQPDANNPPSTNHEVLDETLINTDGISVRITPLANPGYVWDARVWQPEPSWVFKPSEVGQVFGVTMDEAKFPNIYVTATSAYGLHITTPDADNNSRPERVKKGGKKAQWMKGMWGVTDADDPSGAVGGPGTIWKIDGKTGSVSFFANVTLRGQDNSGAGLGNITFDGVHRQFFVSDLSTGMIHRIDLNGKELEFYDHGVTGRAAGKLSPVAFDPKNRLDITKTDFDSEDPETWGYAPDQRRVWGLAVHDGRLFYSVVGDAQIWSVGIEKDTGKFLNDARWEIDVPQKPKTLPVSDIAFTNKGAMILAQRGKIGSTYDYANLADYGKSRTYRYWLENPDDPKTKSRWIAEPQEYAVGFEPENRAAEGGIALSYGYTKEGFIDTGACEATLWATGNNLRQNDDPEIKKVLLKGGPQTIDGLQGMPAGPVKQDPVDRNNTPPWASYMVDIDTANTDQLPTDDPKEFSDITTTGWMGDIAIYKLPCGGGQQGYYGGAGYGWPWGPAYVSNWYFPPNGDPKCTPGLDCPPPPPEACLVPKGDFVCDNATGTWTYILQTGSSPKLMADTIKILGTSGGVTLGAGEIPFSAPSTPLAISGTLSGQLVTVDLCVFDKKASQSGQPFDCCKATITARAPIARCEKKQ
ncbi:MAG: hypothetical protein KGO94_07770 [Alphaproteobacteria bacterium]|nr:hypothetical protein [Alphaproteobacteria bacterium]